jgi:hypothetical protein
MKDELGMDFDTQIIVPLIKECRSLSERLRMTFEFSVIFNYQFVED